MTEAEHERIIAKGHPDHFAKITRPENTTYVLDYTGRNCSYLGPDKKCTIEGEKPDACRAYPVLTVYDASLKFSQYHFDTLCPATKALDETQKQNALFYAEKIRNALSIFEKQKIMLAYEAGCDKKYNYLNFMGASVFLPKP